MPRTSRPASFRLATALAFSSAFIAPPAHGDITYWLGFDPASSAHAQQVANSVAVAAAFYNQHGSFNKHWNVYYNSGIPTAEGNYDGYMGYGGTRNERVVFHEAAHTFGMGTDSNYASLIAGGVWKGQLRQHRRRSTPTTTTATGCTATATRSGPAASTTTTRTAPSSGTGTPASWPASARTWASCPSPGRRGTRRWSPARRPNSGWSPRWPPRWQWKRNGVALTNGGDISGATYRDAADRQCRGGGRGQLPLHGVTGAGETLNSRARQLWVHAAPQLGQWNFNGNATDSVNTSHGTAIGTPAYVAGKIGQAVDLDGADDYIDLPDAVGPHHGPHRRDLGELGRRRRLAAHLRLRHRHLPIPVPHPQVRRRNHAPRLQGRHQRPGTWNMQVNTPTLRHRPMGSPRGGAEGQLHDRFTSTASRSAPPSTCRAAPRIFPRLTTTSARASLPTRSSTAASTTSASMGKALAGSGNLDAVGAEREPGAGLLAGRHHACRPPARWSRSPGNRSRRMPATRTRTRSPSPNCTARPG